MFNAFNVMARMPSTKCVVIRLQTMLFFNKLHVRIHITMSGAGKQKLRFVLL